MTSDTKSLNQINFIPFHYNCVCKYKYSGLTFLQKKYFEKLNILNYTKQNSTHCNI